MPRNSKASSSSKSKITSPNSNGKSKKENKSSLLEKFFTDQLKDMYYAEQQLLKAMPGMIQSTTTEELEDAITAHMKQTERHIKRLEKVFRLIGHEPEGKKCEAMDGLLKEAKEIVKDTKDYTMTRDAALIIGAQKIEHYEIATYGSLVQLAITMGLHQAADILDKTLVEEEETDMLLTQVAENYINLEADEEGPYSWQKPRDKEYEEAGTGSYSM